MRPDHFTTDWTNVMLSHSVNIPLMRRLELQEGIMLETEEGKQVGQSLIAARQGITMVVMSRVAMAAPGKTPGSSQIFC